jgi:O-antigen ligase
MLSYCIRSLGVKRASQCILLVIFSILLFSLYLIVHDKRFASDGFAYIPNQASSDVYGWRGLFSQKNFLAQFCLSSICFLFFSYQELRKNLLYWAAVALCTLLLIKSRGKTSLIIAGFVVMSIGVLTINRLKFKLDVKIVYFLAACGFVVISYLIYTGAILSKFDWTFTGRTKIWAEFWKLGLDKPIFGHGGGDTWKLDDVFGEIRQNARGMASTHDSFLSILFYYGFVGVAIAIGWIISILQSIAANRANPYKKTVAFFTLIAVLGISVFEASISPNISGAMGPWVLLFEILAMGVAQPAMARAAPQRAAVRSRPKPRLRKKPEAPPEASDALPG